jgi:hypothetical protein
MSSLLLDKKMNRPSDELNYMGCNIFREGHPLVHRPDEPSAAHATAKPPRSRKLAMLPLTNDFREWDGPAVLPPRTAQRMCGGLEARGAHRYVP